MIEIKFIDGKKLQEGNVLVSLQFYGEPLSAAMQQIDKQTNQAVQFNVSAEEFVGENGQKMWMSTNGAHPIRKILLKGFGKRKSFSSLEMQEIGAQLCDVISENKKVIVDANRLSGACLAFGILLKAWRFDKYKSETQGTCCIEILCENPAQEDQLFESYRNVYKGIDLARELTSEPANVLFPDAFAKRCLALKEYGLSVEVLDEKAIRDRQLNALLAVGQGSKNPPRIVTLQWKGSQDNEISTALIGKGVCYDSGGIHLKNSHQVEMKWDKAGAATVVGTLLALALNQVPVNVVGVIGLVENMPDGAALKPGDIIKTSPGITIEIVDTDNEGRLVLADCLTLAQELFHPKRMIDLGTLTLETFGALAGEYAGLFCEEEHLRKQLLNAGEASGEQLWPLPLGEAFAKQIQSGCADIKNSGISGFGESSAAAEFLKCFVEKEVLWAHIDISGVAWTAEDRIFNQVGVTGFGVRLLHEWILSQR